MMSSITGAAISPELRAIIDTTYPIFNKVSLVVGGIFGLYLILVVVRIYYERKKVKILQDIRYDLDRLNMHKGISYSKQRKGSWRKLWALIYSWWTSNLIKRSVKKKK